MAQLNIKERQQGNVTILDLAGKMTIGDGSAQLREAVCKLLEEGKKNIVLNVGEVSHLDSSGISELVYSNTATGKQGGRLKLLNLPPKVRNLLLITKLLTVFQTFDNEAEAVQSFA